MSRDSCCVFPYLPPTPLRQGNHSFAPFLISRVSSTQLLYTQTFLLYLFFLKVINTFLMGVLQGLRGKTSLVLESVGKPHSPPVPPTTTVSPQERTHREASMG